MDRNAERDRRESWIPGRDDLPKGILGAIDTGLCAVASGALAIIAVVLTYQVLGRYLIGRPSVWSEELAVGLFVWVAMIGIALGVRRGEHLTLDLISKRVSRSVGKALAILICALSVSMFVILVYYCMKLLGPADRQLLTGVHAGLGIAAKTSWVYAAVPFGMAFAAIFSVERLVLVLTGRVTVMSADADLDIIASLDAEADTVPPTALAQPDSGRQPE